MKPQLRSALEELDTAYSRSCEGEDCIHYGYFLVGGKGAYELVIHGEPWGTIERALTGWTATITRGTMPFTIWRSGTRAIVVRAALREHRRDCRKVLMRSVPGCIAFLGD